MRGGEVGGGGGEKQFGATTACTTPQISGIAAACQIVPSRSILS